ncbi:MAG: hypothetical protein IIW48_13240 [Clostridia bacterium]|nr:hypothetical protein [Clostridia bacterium]
MDKEKLFSFILVISITSMLAGSVLTVFGGINESTAVKISCILIGGVLSVLSVVCGVLAINIREEE